MIFVKKIYFSLFISLFIVVSVFSQNDKLNRATNFVENWMTMKGEGNRVVETVDSILKNNDNYLYLFHLNPKGFILTNTQNELGVLAYSFEHNTNKDALQKPGVSQFIEGFIDYLEKNNQTLSTESTQKMDIVAVNPLLSSNWDQDYPYNQLCPSDVSGPGGHVYAGCIATAGGQLLNFWQHPVQGRGVANYTHTTYGALTANIGATSYNWTAMASTNYNEIAKLLYHIGVAVYMNYSPSGSGAQTDDLQVAFFKHFYTSPGLRYMRNDMDLVQWKNTINASLNQGIPVLYDGYSSSGGHIWVCDGYNNSGFYHMNWGWGGWSNGYFNLNNLNSFNNNQSVVVNVKPLTASSPVTWIPDDNFENALIQRNFDYELDDYAYTDVLESIQQLIVGNKNIYDFTGIEACTHLEKLICAMNHATTLNLSNSPNLYYLYADSNHLSNLNLTGCNDLSFLSLKNNDLTHLNVSPFSSLTFIDCTNNQLETLDVRNGNNSIISSLKTTNNPELSCIYVSDVNYCQTNLSAYIDTSSVFVTNETECNALSQNEFDIEKDVKIYPNPVNHSLRIDSTFYIEKIEIFTSLGEKIRSVMDTHTIDVAFLSSGVYLLKISFINGFNTQQKFVKN